MWKNSTHRKTMEGQKFEGPDEDQNGETQFHWE